LLYCFEIPTATLVAGRWATNDASAY